MKKIVITGGGAAGAKAASKAKRTNPENIVQLYTNDDNISVSLCGLPYYIEGSVDSTDKLIIRTPEDFRKNGIEVYTNHELNQILPNENKIKVNDKIIEYDELVLALGANVRTPDIENIDIDNVFTLRSLNSARKIREKMLHSKSVLIIGGGYIALELTEAFVKNGLNVTIVEHNPRLMRDFDEDLSKIIQNAIVSKFKGKIETYFSKEIVKFNSDNDNLFISASDSDGNEYPADFCVMSTGAVPNVEVARKSGIKLGITGAIYVDNKLRTNYPNIFACGDCAEKYGILTHSPVYAGLGTIANKEGRIAGINVSGEYHEVFDGILLSTVTRFFEYTISKTGLTVQMANEYSKKMNMEPVAVTIHKKDKASYMPSSGEIVFKLVADKRSGEILGAQSIGCAGNILQRINTITSALQKRSTVDDILYLDLPYAPPFSGSIDPVLTAAYKLKELLDK